MEFDRYSFVILRRGERAGDFANDELSRVQQAHLDHLAAMKEQGHLLVAGPFTEQEDETFRGICIYRTPLDETRRLAESDPSVQAGRMRVEVMTWLTQKGALAFAE